MNDLDLTKALIDKFPTFDPAWPADTADRWFDRYAQLLVLVQQPAAVPPAAADPAPEPAAWLLQDPPERRRPGVTKAIPAAVVAEMQRDQAAGLSITEIAAKHGVAKSTVHRHLAIARGGARQPEATFPSNGHG